MPGQNPQNPATQTDPYASYGGSVANSSAPAQDPYAAYGGSSAQALPQASAPLTEADAASGNFAAQQAHGSSIAPIAGTNPWIRVKAGDGKLYDVHPQDVAELMRRDPQAQRIDTAPPEQPSAVSRVGKAVKRNTVDLVTGLYRAFNDPATDEEKAALLQKVREANAKGDKVPEDIALNPSTGTLALHRILDAPADELLKKSRDEVSVAKDLINNHQYWKGGNLYLSGLADKGLSAIPLVGPAISSASERAEGSLTPAYDKQGNRIAVEDVPNERKDFAGAATDVGAMVAAEHAPAIVRGAGKVAGKAISKVSETASDVKPEWLTKRPEAPKPMHGAPVVVESPLDGPTVGKQLGGKDLSSDALAVLQKHVSDQIPVGSTAVNRLTTAVEPVTKAIADTSSKMNSLVQAAPQFTTSSMQDDVFGEGTLTKEIESMKANLPPSVRKPLGEDIDAVMSDADKALNSTDPAEVLEQRRLLGKKIDWDKLENNPTTPAEVQNLARAKVYRALGDKIHAEIPDTVPLDKTLQPNLELRSHMRTKLGDRVVEDPHAATAEAQSEFKKGKTAIENAAHNAQVEKNWQRIRLALITAGVSSAAIKTLSDLSKLFE